MQTLVRSLGEKKKKLKRRKKKETGALEGWMAGTEG